METDWKKFRALVPVLGERYLAERNARIARKLTDPKKTETERFWDAMDEMEKEAKTLRKCLDGHSRSKMWLYMITMRAAGMLKKEDLADFSEEIQKQVFDDPFAPTGQQGARANDHGRHAACYRTIDRNEAPESESSCRTRRASHGRGSSLTLGEEPCEEEL